MDKLIWVFTFELYLKFSTVQCCLVKGVRMSDRPSLQLKAAARRPNFQPRAYAAYLLSLVVPYIPQAELQPSTVCVDTHIACKAIFQSKQEINYRLHEQIAQARAEQQRTNAKLKWELQRRHMPDRVGKYVGLDDVSGGYIPGECSQKQDGQKSCRNSFTCKHKKASCRVQVKVST